MREAAAATTRMRRKTRRRRRKGEGGFSSLKLSDDSNLDNKTMDTGSEIYVRMRSEASLLRVGLGALGGAMAWLSGLLMHMASKEVASEAIVVEGRTRWTVGLYLRAAESVLTGRGMLRAVAMGILATVQAGTGQGMRQAAAREGMAAGAILSKGKIE